MANTREYLLIWDSTMANPNGDMLSENKPRIDESTGQLEVSDVRIKRYVRDEWIKEGKDVLVQTLKDDKGKILSCQDMVKNIQAKENLDDNTLLEHVLNNYIDVKLFGAVITKPKRDIMGPLQVMWSKSLHEAEVKFMQGNAAYASGSGKEQASIWSKYISPYVLFKTYAIYNENVAKVQNINVEEEDLESFKKALINGLKNYRSTSKNQMPRVLIEIIYNDNNIDGELDYIDVVYKENILPTELREISQVEIDLIKLNEYIENKKDSIKTVNIYKHGKVNLVNEPDANIKTI
ncbi:type I-B CRISPR-associated protein Cas7/Csh2 [Methanococcus voltae]|uniref:CRISPR-associated protein, Csh2 family n=1 Tax=Methanococcus voltae (strain ATCC BAA-1334 / A3) TaxID=456320 RepID=D7DSS5_METV3|nr:type I-B CRISPR-associated protein Cas7/Csh2 [Methanococcus voltae]MCS3901786.1 CRISPR-associated protein Csh2 [Methanococcus voltae]